MSALDLLMFATQTPVARSTMDHTRVNVSRVIQEMERQTVQVYGLYLVHHDRTSSKRHLPNNKLKVRFCLTFIRY